MSNATTAPAMRLRHGPSRPVLARFDQPHASADGGAMLLNGCDARYGLSEALAAAIDDRRDPRRVTHSVLDLVRQRVFGIALGYPDGNDASRLAQDPMARLLLGRDPLRGASIASQPTLSRFENALDGRSLVRMGRALAEHVVARHRRRLGSKVRRVTIDLDPTDDAVHGAQQLSAFSAHYDGWCYLPTAAFLTFGKESEQYLFAYVLRPGDVGASYGAEPLLERAFELLRGAFARVRIRVRLDSGFATPELLDFLEDAQVEYVVGIAVNSTLRASAERLLRGVRRRSAASGQSEHAYGECRYSAARWDSVRRVIIKAEITCQDGRAARDNPRFVLTNLTQSPAHVYRRVYCHRAHVELRIKELLHGLSIDRTSCTSFLANQGRCLLAAAAAVLMQELRLGAARTALAGAQFTRLRECLLKLGVWFEEARREIVMHLPANAPWRHEWCCIARTLGVADPLGGDNLVNRSG